MPLVNFTTFRPALTHYLLSYPFHLRRTYLLFFSAFSARILATVVKSKLYPDVTPRDATGLCFFHSNRPTIAKTPDRTTPAIR